MFVGATLRLGLVVEDSGNRREIRGWSSVLRLMYWMVCGAIPWTLGEVDNSILCALSRGNVSSLRSWRSSRVKKVVLMSCQRKFGWKFSTATKITSYLVNLCNFQSMNYQHHKVLIRWWWSSSMKNVWKSKSSSFSTDIINTKQCWMSPWH